MSRFAFSVLGVLAALPAAAATIDAQVRDSGGAALADAVVYAMPASGPVEARGARTAEIEQIDREFVPYVTVVQTGTSVAFPNRDPILHHVYSFSQAKPFEIKLYSGKAPRAIVFDHPGIVTLGCNIHDWMVGYVVVVSTPWFARTDASGRARLADLPAGRYEVHAWHPRQRAQLAPAALGLEAQGVAAPAFVIDAAPRRPRYKPPLDRLKY
ncbi:MAG TPA: methylamine utilization protein [Usitatibacter sp.]|jgi:plastocyanin|nr:methylamine utilization protein [Usitatibacter sp.]